VAARPVRSRALSSSSSLNAAYVTTADPADVRGWSGTYHHVATALEAQGISLDYVGPLVKRYEQALKAKEGVYRYLLRRRHPRDREPLIARNYARQVAARLGPQHDLVFAVGTIPISYLDCVQPIVAWTDATFAGLVDFYPMYSNVSEATLRNGHAMEAAALHRCELAIYSSDWAASSAISDYGVDPGRVAVVPFGANMDTELSDDEAEAAVAARPGDACRLLFIGVDWERKGGDYAVAVAEALNAAGVPTTLDVVGSWPTRQTLPEFVNRNPFIDKTSEDGRRALRELMLGAHFFVLPARADCSPVVLNEAAAHALPALVSNVGGIPTIVRDEASGKLFSSYAEPSDYREYVLRVLAEPTHYRLLALGALEEYRSRLNWRVAGAAVRELVADVTGSRERRR
jgi:glycosyltransferase involved in cell wall biosynthesis